MAFNITLPREGTIITVNNGQRRIFIKELGFIRPGTVDAFIDDRTGTVEDPVAEVDYLGITFKRPFGDMLARINPKWALHYKSVTPLNVKRFDALSTLTFDPSKPSLVERINDLPLADVNALNAMVERVFPESLYDRNVVIRDGVIRYSQPVRPQRTKKRAFAETLPVFQTGLPLPGTVIKYKNKKFVFIPELGFVNNVRLAEYISKPENPLEAAGLQLRYPVTSMLLEIDPDYVANWSDTTKQHIIDRGIDLPPELFFKADAEPSLAKRLIAMTVDERREMLMVLSNTLVNNTLDYVNVDPNDGTITYLFAERNGRPIRTEPLVPRAESAAKAKAGGKPAAPPADLAEIYTPQNMLLAAMNDRGSIDGSIRSYFPERNDNARREANQLIGEPSEWNRLTPERQKEVFFRGLSAPVGDQVDMGTSWTAAKMDEYLYTLSMFCPKADPLGRYILCDLFIVNEGSSRNLKLFSESASYSNETVYVTYAGLPKPFWLGTGGPTVREEMDFHSKNNEPEFSGRYLRMHSPNGVKIQGIGMGTVLYGGTAVAAAFGGRYIGTYSKPYRSAEAQAWWMGAVSRGMAIQNNTDPVDDTLTDHDEDGVRVCFDEFVGKPIFKDARRSGSRSWANTREELQRANGASHYINEGRVKRVCIDDVTVNFPKYVYPGSQAPAAELLPAINVINSGLVPFIALNKKNESDPLLNPAQRGDWNPVSDPTGNMELTFVLPQKELDAYTKQRLSEKTAHLLARASFGPSPRLALLILNTLTAGGHDELARQYLARKDIAALIGSNKTALGILHSGRLPAFQGMSKRRMSNVLSGLSEGLEPTFNPKNPLNIPPMPASIKRQLDALAFEG